MKKKHFGHFIGLIFLLALLALTAYLFCLNSYNQKQTEHWESLRCTVVPIEAPEDILFHMSATNEDGAFEVWYPTENRKEEYLLNDEAGNPLRIGQISFLDRNTIFARQWRTSAHSLAWSLVTYDLTTNVLTELLVSERVCAAVLQQTGVAIDFFFASNMHPLGNDKFTFEISTSMLDTEFFRGTCIYNFQTNEIVIEENVRNYIMQNDSMVYFNEIENALFEIDLNAPEQEQPYTDQKGVYLFSHDERYGIKSNGIFNLETGRRIIKENNLTYWKVASGAFSSDDHFFVRSFLESTEDIPIGLGESKIVLYEYGCSVYDLETGEQYNYFLPQTTDSSLPKVVWFS